MKTCCVFVVNKLHYINVMIEKRKKKVRKVVFFLEHFHKIKRRSKEWNEKVYPIYIPDLRCKLLLMELVAISREMWK